MTTANSPLFSSEPHSKEFLTAENRNFWWDQDYLELLAKRLDLTAISF